MSKIQEITAFMREDFPAMQKQAEEIHKTMMDAKANFTKMNDGTKAQLAQFEKDLAEWMVAMGPPPNEPPTA